MTQVQTFDFSVDLLRALLWQYNDAARLEALVRRKQAWYDVNQQTFWEDWVRDVFDLRTANDFGLCVWAIILNISQVIPTPEDLDEKNIWGFGEYRETFNNGNFARSSSRLTLEQRRLVVRLRYFQLVTKGAVPEINAFLKYLFSTSGRVYVADGLNMTARYVFEFDIPAELFSIFTEFDILPRPAGVKISFVSSTAANGWGFGQYRETFNNGNFHHA
jgi:hypothetical protein